MPQGFLTQPVNRIAADTEAVLSIREYEVGANATAAKMLPGRAVIYDTIAGDVKEVGDEADSILGVLETGPDMAMSTTPASCTAYAVGDQCWLIRKGVCKVVLKAGTAAVAPGNGLKTVGDGYFGLLEVGALGAQGGAVAKALEIVNPAAADSFCLAELTGAVEAMAAA